MTRLQRRWAVAAAHLTRPPHPLASLHEAGTADFYPPRLRLRASSLLLLYSGEVVSESEYNGSSAYAVGVEDAAGCSFVVDAADATVSSVARYMNHAASGAAECNCVLTEQGALAVDMAPSGLPRLLMYTTRAIEAGSELCWDYGEPYWAEVAHLGRFRAP